MSKARDLANAGTALTTVSATELGYLDGVTSAVQTQLNAKQAVVSGVDSTEIGYLNGVTSAIQTQIDAQIPDSLLTTTGDVIYASGANTPARLGIGTTGQVLQVSGGLPAWGTAPSGGMTLISTTTLTGASITLSSIPSTYNSLNLIIRNFLPANDNTRLMIRFNGDAATRYQGIAYSGFGSAANSFAQDAFRLCEGNDNAVGSGLITTQILDYANTNTWKVTNSIGMTIDATTTTSFRINGYTGTYNQTSAISSITLLAETGNLTSGTVLLYGVK